MAVSFILTNAGRTACANPLDTGLAGGSIKLYTVDGGTLLATVPLKATNIGTVSNGVITIDCTNTTCTAGADGTATYAEFQTSGSTKWAGANVGIGVGYTVNLVNNVIANGQTVTITSASITVPAGT